MLLQPLNYLGLTKDYSEDHKAIDLGWSKNHGGSVPPVFALDDGAVSKVYTTETGGNCLEINYGAYTSIYKHLKRIYVKVGDSVYQGQTVAQMGSTGTAATGNHLHFELYYKGESVVPYEHFFYDENATVSPKEINKGKFQPAPAFQVGDKVKIIAKGNARKDGTGKACGGVGWIRYVKAIYEDEPYPYKIGSKLATTGYYTKEAIEKYNG